MSLAVLTAPALAQQPKEPREQPEDFPDGPHRENAFYSCTACHSFKIVAAQGMSRERWSETLDWMQERHNLPKTEGKDRAELLDYLSTAFPARGGRGGWKNPFQQ